MDLLMIIPLNSQKNLHPHVSPPSIIPRKSIVLLLSISPPLHADLLSHVTSRTVDQRILTLPLISPPTHARKSVVLPPSIIPRKSIVSSLSISPPAPADLPLHLSSWTVDQPREESLRLCRWSVHMHPLVPSCMYEPHRRPVERSSILSPPLIIVSESTIVVFLPWISPPTKLTLPSYPSVQAKLRS